LAVLLDTDHISVLHRKERPAFDRLETPLDTLPADAISVSFISFQEQARGWLAFLHRAKKPRQILTGFADL
jgi:hypothetical protein